MRPAALLMTVGALASAVAACGDDEGSTGSAGDPDPSAAAPPRETAERLESCLADEGTRVLLMPGPPEEKDKDAPDFAVAFQRGLEKEGGGQIAIYATEDEAALRLPGIERNAENFDGVVEPRGSITVIFFATPTDDVRNDVLACLPAE